MEFGKTPHIDKIQFALPADEPRSIQVLSKAGTKDPLAFYVGAPIWACKEWVGKIYPKNTNPKDFLRHYSRQFNSIELNSSFYSLPDSKTIETWCEAVPPYFKFCPKVSQAISHQSDTHIGEKLFSQFFHVVQNFGNHLGMCFLQLPPHFTPHHFFYLERLLKVKPPEIQLAVEFRHPAWFEKNSLRQRAFDLLSGHQVATVITDVAGRRDVLHASLPTAKTMIRFVGNELHPSDYTRITAWVERIKNWQSAGIHEIYFFIHHPTSIHVPELSYYFIEKLNYACGLGLQQIRFVVEENQQMTLF